MIHALLNNQNTFLSPDEIFTEIQNSEDEECDRASVYRALGTFEKLGLVRRSNFQGDAARYALSETVEKKTRNYHVHFFKCIECNVIEPFSGCLVAKKEQELEKEGYRNLSHHLEITGLCPNCAKNESLTLTF